MAENAQDRSAAHDRDDDHLDRAHEHPDGHDGHSRAITRTAQEGMFTLDADGHVLAASPSVTEMFGNTPDQLAGAHFATLVSEPYREEWVARFDRLRRAAEENGASGDRREVFARRVDDDSVFPVVLSTSAVVNGDVHRFVVIVHDRTRERQLERRLYEAEEQERRRIGHELHDSVGGQLTGVEIAGSLLHRKLREDDSPHASDAGELVEHLRELHQRLRNVSRGLLPVQDDPLGLVTALRRLVKLNHGRNGTRCLFRCEQEVAIADTGVATNLYHIAEEAVQNAVRHAEATQIVIELSEPEEGRIVLEVRDDGIGIPDAAGTGDGIGMDSMAYRANLIDARFQILPAAPSGTRVCCIVDLDQRRGD